MNRRSFSKTSAASAALACIGSAPFVHGARKTDDKTPVIGVPGHQYECHHLWGELPKNFVWQTTHGVAVDQQGLIYIKHQGHGGKQPVDTILVFEPSGKFVRSFGRDYFPGGHGIDIRNENGTDFLYLCDVHHREVIKATLKGEEIWKFSFPLEANVYKRVKQFSPTNIAFAPDGGFYVGDGYGSSYVHQYDGNAKWVRTWGGKGKENGKMQTPHGIWLDNRPGREAQVVVADRANARLQYFTLDGKFVAALENLVKFPAHFDIRGDVLMVPDLHARVSLLDKDNKPLVHLGEDKDWREKVVGSLGKGKDAVRNHPDQWPAGKFIHPHDACFDKDGNIFVAEWVDTGRITFMRKVG